MKRYQKIWLSVLVVVVAIAMSFSLQNAKPAQAFGGIPSWVEIATWISNKAKYAYSKVESALTSQLLTRTVETYVNNLAYTMATNIASNGAGGKPLFETKNVKDALQQAQDAAAGEFIGQLSANSFSQLGFNLCDPSLNVKISVTLGLIDSTAPPPPTCNWQKVKAEWAKFGNLTVSDMVKFQLDTAPSAITGSTPLAGSSNGTKVWQNYDDFFKSFSLEQSDWGAFDRLNDAYAAAQAKAVAAKDSYLKICQGYLNGTTVIKEDVKVTCKAIVDSQGAALSTLAVSDIEKIKLPAQNSANPNLGQVMKNAGKYFLSTLASKSQPIFMKLMNKWLKQGMASAVALFNGGSNSSLRDDLLAQLRGGADLYQPRGVDLFSDFKKISFDSVEAYSFLDDFAICPEEVQYRTPDNCVISADFLQAVNSRVTVQEAINSGYINGGLPFIGQDDALRNSSSQCYKDGLCYSNLVKLRKANIIPVGWEMVALKSPTSKPVTLQQAIDCFEDDTSKCTVPANGHNPYYHLVDPNWVLKAPPTYCNAYVYSPVLEAPDTSNRQQYCADAKVCLREDDKGNCLDGQYGYCTKSENVWRFQGDICQDGDIYSGCLTFANADKPQASYIESSLNYCTADQVGCKRYSQEKNNAGEWIFQSLATDDNDLFLNKQAANCSASDAGCSEYIVMAANTGANLVANGDFSQSFIDNTTGQPNSGQDIPYGWFGDNLTTPSNGIELKDGQIANGYTYITGTGAAGTETFQQKISLLPNTTYIISASAAQHVGNPNLGEARISMLLCDHSGNCDSNNLTTNTNLAGPVAGVGNCNSTSKSSTDLDFIPAGLTMERKSCTFTTNQFTYGGLLNLLANNPSPYIIWFDDIKLEMADNARAASSLTNTPQFSSYGDGAKITMNSSRSMCTEQEVGCQGYTPSNGDPMIPAVIGQNDLCPAQCVGYASFAQQTDIFDQVDASGNNQVEYYNFIPQDKNTKTCPAQAVGCEEFTNLDEVSRGGEGKEYYTFLRQCVAETLGHTYYTWEGSDVAGYQIKTWLALPSGDGGPCTNIAPSGDTCLDNTPGKPTATCTTANAATDPNCRQFFDAGGASYYRYQDRIILASADCHDYRRTMTGSTFRAIPSLSTQCQAQYKDCRSYAGNTANNVHEIFSNNFEQGTYAPWHVYGTINGTTETSPTVDLSPESLENNGHSFKLVKHSNWADMFRDFPEARDKTSYQVSWWMKNSTVITNMDVKLLFYYKAPPDGPGGEVFVNEICNGSRRSLNGFLLHSCDDSTLTNISAGNWHRFQVQNTIDFSKVDLQGHSLSQIDFSKTLLVIEWTDTSIGDEIYMDNIIFKEVTDNISVIKNSWQTPVVCDTPYSGYYLGCQSYTDTNKNIYNLKSFSNLCRVEAIGCMPAIDTHNSSNPFAETFNSGDNSQITVPADNITYLVPDSAKYCDAAYKGCMALGVADPQQPNYLMTVYKINNPDLYNSTLCPSAAVGCDAYSSDKGTYYFRDPGSETCTYQKNIMINNRSVSGWFKTNTLKSDKPIECNDYNNSGAVDLSDYLLYSKGARPGAYLCPADKNLCTTFIDPTDPQDCTLSHCANNAGTLVPEVLTERDCLALSGRKWIPGTCQSYYYYNNDNIDNKSCAGQVDKNGGCVLFYDANNWNADHSSVPVTYDAAKTYDSNVSTGRPVNPVNCDASTDPTCDLNTNTILKVNKDRQCGEWLACRSSSVVWDNDTNKYKVVCDDLSLCNKFDADNNITKCGNWVSPSNVPLTESVYQSRSTGANNHLQWSDGDYTGFSIPNYMPIAALSVVNFGTTASPSPRLVYVGGICSVANGQPCIMPLAGATYTGVCQAGQCTIGPDLSTKNWSVDTRGYASIDAPFPTSISPDQNQLDRLAAYAGANICLSPSTMPNGCELTYMKLTYSNSADVRYYPINSPSPNGICTSGNLDGNIDCVDSSGVARNSLCDTYNDDGTSRGDGLCSKKTKAETISNWPGICLEKDINTKLVNDTGDSFYCNQWYPAEQINGMNSLYDNYREAGYYNPTGQDALFCAESEPYVLQKDRIYCGLRGGTDPRNCNMLIRVPSGSRVVASAAAGNSVFINYGYLRDGTYKYTPGNLTDAALPYMLDRLEKAGLSGDVGYLDAKFNVDDFVLQTGGDKSVAPVISLGLARSLFDVVDAAKKIEFFYYDEDVHGPANSTDGREARIWVGDMVVGSANTVSCQTGANDGQDYDAQGMCDSCSSDYMLDGKNGTWGWHGVWNGFCNPLPYNYYVKAQMIDGAFDDRPCKGPGGIDVPCKFLGMVYPAETSGTICTGLQCFQQCRVVTDLDAEGDKSWVRTDIWWRNENGQFDNYATSSLWSSYYFKNGFIRNSNLRYSGIEGENVSFTHFGSALGFVGKDVVNVRAPVNVSAFSPLSAATFYHNLPDGTADGALVTEFMGGAGAQLDYLMQRAFNLKWSNSNQSYEYLNTATIYGGLSDVFKINKNAGAEYSPIILKVCGNSTCNNALGLTINDVNSANVSAQSSMMATLKFYYFAHPDHMPVTNISINWGDGSSQISTPGKYKNNIPVCDSDLTMPGSTSLQGFGGTDRACRAGYKIFYHDYQISPPGNATCPANAPTNSKCFKPSVTVTDHWGLSGTVNFDGVVMITPAP